VSTTIAPRARGSRIPLRITLVALLVALVAVGLLATGFAATSLLRGYLTHQQDDELTATAHSIANDPRRASSFCGAGAPRYPSAGFVGCIVPDGNQVLVFAGPVDHQGRLPAVDRLAGAVDEPDGDGDEAGPGLEGSRPFTVPAQDGSTSWRMVAVHLADGSVALVGSDLTGDEKVIGRLVRIELIVGLIVLALLGAAGYALVRNSLRPLTEVERPRRRSRPATCPSGSRSVTTAPRSAGCRGR